MCAFYIKPLQDPSATAHLTLSATHETNLFAPERALQIGKTHSHQAPRLFTLIYRLSTHTREPPAVGKASKISKEYTTNTRQKKFHYFLLSLLLLQNRML